MAVVAPIAEWHPLTRPTSTIPLQHDIICLHTMVGTLEGSYSWSNRVGGTYWHFGLGGDGELWQCADLRYKSAANLEGNPYCIPIETEDTNAGQFPSPYANPLWTPAQIAKLGQLVAWLCVRYNIPPVLIPDTRKGRRGIGFHAQGIQGSPYYKGGLNWSKPFNGKTCPNRRITQVDDVIRLVRQILGTGPPPPGEWDEMATQAEVEAALDNVFDRQMNLIQGVGGTDQAYQVFAKYVYDAARRIDDIEGKVDQILAKLNAEEPPTP
jgi:hypothetical protein